MPRVISHELTDDLYQRLSGSSVDEHSNKIILVHTVDPNGWPHPAILSYFEVAAKDPRSIRLAMYKTSHTTENVRRTGKITLSVFDERLAYYVKGAASELCSEMECAPYNCVLDVAVEQVLADRADPVREPGAYVAGGITYWKPDSPQERTRTVSILKELLK